MSDTPETDEQLAYRSFGFYTMGGLPTDAVSVEFARKLERERDDLRNELSDTIRACHIWQQGHSAIVADRDHWRAEAERWRALSYNTEKH